jgi:hypothetical protein
MGASPYDCFRFMGRLRDWFIADVRGAHGRDKIGFVVFWGNLDSSNLAIGVDSVFLLLSQQLDCTLQ